MTGWPLVPHPSAQRPRASERRSVGTGLHRTTRIRRVLNARGHRSGGRLELEGIDSGTQTKCSTPEGIGAEVGPAARSKACASAPSSAQRPRASERRSEQARRNRAGLPSVLNARGHRSGGRSSTPHSAKLSRSQCSTPEGIGAEVGLRRCRGRLARDVLNARGHRSGGRWNGSGPGSTGEVMCSTPEGIGAEVGFQRFPTRATIRPWCSTPEGIGAEVGEVGALEGDGKLSRVLNARGHRSGGRSLHRKCTDSNRFPRRSSSTVSGRTRKCHSKVAS